ncbi:MAG: DDE-type integrase/transposase/recombinase, partial [Gemmatimonadaceae bacterium]
MTTGERRAVVTGVQARYPVSERYACRALGFERSVVRFVPQRPVLDAPLREKLVNYKRVERLYRLEGLAVRRRKRKRLAVPRPIATGPNETWSLDFVSDQLRSGRRFRCLTLIDSCTRECLAITVAYSLPSTAVIAALEAVIAGRDQPTRLSRDNGSEFRSRAFDAWAADRGIAL